MSKTTLKNSSLISGLKSSYSSGKGFSLGGNKAANQPAAPIAPTVIQPQTPQPTAQVQQQPVVIQTTPVEPIITQPIPADPAVAQPAVVQPISQEEQLETLDQVIDQVASERPEVVQPDPLASVAQAVPQAVASIQDPLNPPNPSPVGAAKKEVHVVDQGVAVEQAAPTVEHPGGVQSVEQERVPEIAPEVESFLQHAEEQTDHLPQEIVVADNQEVSAVTHHPKKPVIVLPITAGEQKKGKKKSTKLSVRWLVEWSEKLMKKFSGKVIYREEK